MRQLYLPMRIWDLPIRLFHWLLVVLLLVSWLTQWRNWMRLHMLCGLAILTLLLFRVLWGFIGSDTARFSHFLRSPVEAVRHLMRLTRREPDTEAGHNAAGGWSVVALLAILFVQVGTGLGANDDAIAEGPIAGIVGKDWSNWLSHIHHLNFTVIEIAVVLHVLAIVAYRVLKGQNLLLPMVTGKKRLPGATRAVQMMHPGLALAVYALSVVVVGVFLKLVGFAP
jgi:cytochrome b